MTGSLTTAEEGRGGARVSEDCVGMAAGVEREDDACEDAELSAGEDDDGEDDAGEDDAGELVDAGKLVDVVGSEDGLEGEAVVELAGLVSCCTGLSAEGGS